MLPGIHRHMYDQIGFFYNLRTSPAQYGYYSDNVLDKIYVQSRVFGIYVRESTSISYHVSYFIVRGDKENVFFFFSSLDIFLIVSEKYN